MSYIDKQKAIQITALSDLYEKMVSNECDTMFTTPYQIIWTIEDVIFELEALLSQGALKTFQEEKINQWPYVTN